MGEDKAHEGRVGLEELRAVNWKNINWSEFRDTISKDTGVGSSRYFRSIAQEVTNGFSGSSQRKIRFSGEHQAFEAIRRLRKCPPSLWSSCQFSASELWSEEKKGSSSEALRS